MGNILKNLITNLIYFEMKNKNISLIINMGYKICNYYFSNLIQYIIKKKGDKK